MAKTSLCKDRVGLIFNNSYGTPYEVIEYLNNHEVYVKFLDEHGYVTKCGFKECKKGTIKNPYDRTIYGLGFHGIGKDGKHLKTNNREGILWKNMFVRCYSESCLATTPTYANCEVCERWRSFANFLDDLPLIDGYKEWLINRDYQLDKDLKQQGVKNKIYSLETCCFVPSHINAYENHSRSCLNAKKPVVAFNFLKNSYSEFESVSEASTILPFSVSSISMKCNGKQGQINWIILYKEDLPKFNIEEINYEDLLKFESERGTGSLGSSGK